MESHDIALITDSASDLPRSLLDQYDIRAVPLYLIWGDEQLHDRVDITPEEFYQRLTSDPVHPSTSQPTPSDFAEALSTAFDDGAQEVVVITISSGMSSTYNSARQGIEMLGSDKPVHLVDSRANSMSQGWQVLAAARARASGADAPAMVQAASHVRQTLATHLYVDTLEYLHKGGRIGLAARWVGAAINLKPQLFVNHITGEIEPGARTRTRSKALNHLVTTFFDKMDTSRPLHIAVLHGDVQHEAEALAQRIKADYDPAELIVTLTSPVLGVHTGPGALALCGYYEIDRITE